MEQSPDSKITITAGDSGENVVTIPAWGVRFPRLGPALYYLFWLGISMLVIVSAVKLALAPAEPSPARLWPLLILVLWSCWAVPVLSVAVVWMLTIISGIERLVVGGDELVQTVALFGLSRTRRYLLKDVSRFENVPAWGFFRLWPILNECSLVLGRRRAPVAYRVTGAEAEWLAQELNALLERRRR
jgi:hypothetical protein